MKIYIVRHGETDWNGPRRLQGRSDIPLNETGIEEAKITGEALKDVPFAAAFVSPLTRTRQTAELLIRDRHIPVYEDARIIEMCFGVYEGLSVVNPKYLVKDPVYCDVFLNHPDQYEAPEGGEPQAIGGGTYAKAAENCAAFGPAFPGEDTHIHDCDEFMDLESLERATAIYYRAIELLMAD